MDGYREPIGDDGSVSMSCYGKLSTKFVDNPVDGMGQSKTSSHFDYRFVCCSTSERVSGTKL